VENTWERDLVVDKQEGRVEGVRSKTIKTASLTNTLIIPFLSGRVSARKRK